MKKKQAAYDDGSLIATTTGDVVRLLVDSGDPAVTYRVVGKKRLSDKKYAMTMEVTLIPNGFVGKEIGEAEYIGSLLKQFLENGVLK